MGGSIQVMAGGPAKETRSQAGCFHRDADWSEINRSRRTTGNIARRRKSSVVGEGIKHR